MSVTDTDRGAKRLMVWLGVGTGKGLAKHNKLTVGIHRDDGEREYPNKATLAQVAASHEFGLNVPQRSWLRGWFDARSLIKFGGELQDVVFEVMQGKREIEDALNNLGIKYVAEIQKRINEHIAPELSPRTVQNKKRAGSSTPDVPLEDTHVMINAIRQRVNIK